MKFTTLFLLVFSSYVAAVNRCIDPDGKVSFQDQPCQVSDESEHIDLAEPSPRRGEPQLDPSKPAGVEPLFVTIPGVGEAIILSYQWWDADIIQPDPTLPPTVRMRSKPGAEPLSLTLTFLPNKLGRALTTKENAEAVQKISAPYVESSIEQKIILKRLDTLLVQAVLANFNERKYQNAPVPPGEYSSITVGQVVHPQVGVAITLLTSGVASRAHGEALDILSSFTIVPTGS